MSEELERIKQLEKEIRKLKDLNNEGIPTYSFSTIKVEELESIVDIEQNFNKSIFTQWFDNQITLAQDIPLFLEQLLEKESDYLEYYHEEDLKIKFITPILNKIDFTVKEIAIKDFYESQLRYKTDRFILNGTTDFVVSKGVKNAKKPYFFIQEFKQGRVRSDPEPQLLAELISAVELNNWKTIKGAYIVGSLWNFVILEKLGEDSYQYFVSINFDSSKIEDLKTIYKNLLFVKREVIQIVEMEGMGDKKKL